MADRAPNWGIEPVPRRLRTFGTLDNGLLWGSLGLSLLVLVAGTVLVPGLSLPAALLAIAVGGIFGNALLGAAAWVGADARVPAMVLLTTTKIGHRLALASVLLVACSIWIMDQFLCAFRRAI